MSGTHVLLPVHRRFEIHVFYVGTCKTGARCADGAIPKKFGVDHVCGTRCELERVVDEVAADRDSYPVRIYLLGPMVDDDSCICYSAICWYQSDCVVREKKDGVRSCCKTRLALYKPMEFLAHCWNPEVFEIGVVLQFLYCVMVSFVTGWTTPKQCSLMSPIGPVHCELVATLNALSRDLGRSTQWRVRPCCWLVVYVVVGFDFICRGPHGH